MSGLGPLQPAFVDAALALDLSLAELETQLRVGDVLSATILAPRGGQDLIAILGRVVTAQLPAGLYPGETLRVQVTGFSAGRIFVQNLEPPGQAPAPPSSGSTRAAAPPAPANAPAAAPSNPSPPAGARVAEPERAALAPPRAVFVAASVRPAGPPLPGASASSRRVAPQPAAPRDPTAPAARAVTQRTVAPQALAEPVARLPKTVLVRAAAAIAPRAVARLPAVLARLDAVLARLSADPRAAAIRTIAAFVGTIDAAHEQTLAAQIASFVSHVVEGSEAKLAQLLHAAAGAKNESSAQPSPLPAQGRVAERTAAIGHDLKSLLFALAREPSVTRTPEVAHALNAALVTVTGVQLETLSGAASDPGGVAFGLPLFYRDGGEPAQIRISRDTSSGSPKLDADNFHVAFVLDTAHLGTVAIDLQATGRAVSVEVKTEQKASAARFAATLDSLRARLERLRYRVRAAGAHAVARPISPAAAPERSTRAAAGSLDLRA